MSLTYKLERGKKHNEDGITLARNRTGKGGLEAERVGYYMLLLLLHLKSKVSTSPCLSAQAMQGRMDTHWLYLGGCIALPSLVPVRQ